MSAGHGNLPGVTQERSAGLDVPGELHRYLQEARDRVLSSLDGLGDYDIRRPLTPTGTNLLGLVKHLASIESGYLGDCLGRPSPIRLPWVEDGSIEDGADMWAAPGESRADLTGLYQSAWRHSDESISDLGLTAPAHVPWWPADPGARRDRPACRARRHRPRANRRPGRTKPGRRRRLPVVDQLPRPRAAGSRHIPAPLTAPCRCGQPRSRTR